MTTHLAAAAQRAAGLPIAGVGLSLAAVALLGGIAIAMHHKGKSARIIGWIAFACGIPLAELLSGVLGYLSGLSLWSIPVSLAVTGYVAFVFFHDGFARGRRSGASRGTVAVAGSRSGGSSGAHRWLQPIFGLFLPALLLTLGGSLGTGIHSVLDAVNSGLGNAVQHATGK